MSQDSLAALTQWLQRLAVTTASATNGEPALCLARG